MHWKALASVSAWIAVAKLWTSSLLEPLQRSVKYETVYLWDYETVPTLHQGLRMYFTFYNSNRPHQSLAYLTPAEVHYVH